MAAKTANLYARIEPDVKEQADKKPVCLGWLFQWRSPPGKRKKSGVRRS